MLLKEGRKKKNERDGVVCVWVCESGWSKWCWVVVCESFLYFFTEGTLYLRTGRVRPRTDCLAREKDISDIIIKGREERREWREKSVIEKRVSGDREGGVVRRGERRRGMRG